jgi:1,2-diacylglycerol 3-alpha-glucosyltransferase
VRVLFISDVYFPRVNGVSTSIRTFREDLARCGVETLLIAPEYEGSAQPDERGVIRVPAGAVPKDPEDRRLRWGALGRALEALQPTELDLIHVQTPFVAHYAGTRFARRWRIPCIETYHTFFEEYVHHYVPALPRSVGRTLARAITRSQCRDVQALIAPSEPLRQSLLGYGIRTPVHVIPTGLPADRFTPGDGRRFREHARLPAGRPLITYIGRVAHEKNIEFLVRMFVRVRERMPEAMLVIAGEGPARESLRRLVCGLGLDNDVHFAGYLDRNTALLDCYAAAAVFVFASRTETQGLVLLEAMAQGVPIVSTAELGTRSVLLPGCGAVVVEEREDPFARAVVRVLTDPGLASALSQQGRPYARAWSSAAMAGRMADLYRSFTEPANSVARCAQRM